MDQENPAPTPTPTPDPDPDPSVSFLPPSSWTSERIALLKAFVADGMQNSDIARALNTTKNAIIGKRDRMGLHQVDEPTRPKPRRSRRSPRPILTSWPPVSAVRPADGVHKIVDHALRGAETAPLSLPSEPRSHHRGVDYMKNQNGCRALLDVTGYLGLPRVCGRHCVPLISGTKSPWCREHYDMYYVKPRKR